MRRRPEAWRAANNEDNGGSSPGEGNEASCTQQMISYDKARCSTPLAAASASSRRPALAGAVQSCRRAHGGRRGRPWGRECPRADRLGAPQRCVAQHRRALPSIPGPRRRPINPPPRFLLHPSRCHCVGVYELEATLAAESAQQSAMAPSEAQPSSTKEHLRPPWEREHALSVLRHVARTGEV